MPPMVTSNMTRRKPQPASPPIVPASSVRMRLNQAASKKLGVSAPSGASKRPPMVMIKAATEMITSVMSARPPINADVPRAIRLSNQ